MKCDTAQQLANLILPGLRQKKLECYVAGDFVVVVPKLVAIFHKDTHGTEDVVKFLEDYGPVA